MARKKQPKKSIKLVLPFIVVFTLLLLLEASYFGVKIAFNNRLPFGIEIANAAYGLTPTEQATADLEQRIADYLNQPIVFQSGNDKLEIFPSDFDLRFSLQPILDEVRSNLISFRSITLPVALNEHKLRSALLSAKPTLEHPAVNATVHLDENGGLIIQPGEAGHKTDFANLAKLVQGQAGNLSSIPIVIASETIEPGVSAEKLARYQTVLLELLQTPLIFKASNYQNFEINLADRLTWFDFSTPEDSNTEPSINGIYIKYDEFKKFTDRELGAELAEMSYGVAISQNLENKVIFDGIAKSGRIIDLPKLYENVNQALASGQKEIWIPFKKLVAPVTVSQDLKNYGITELIGEALTNYKGSPQNRQHNIRVAAEILNGQFIEPGEDFSFIAALGPVVSATGYRSELVIKEGDVVPEIGGGVCQVSTTFFRTVLDAGLPVTAQKPHTLKVSYYNPPGLDATVYPGSADLRFINDTGKPILIQTHIEGTTLRVNFYGTADGRKVELAGPFYPNGEPIKDLRKAGMAMYWTRKVVSKSGEEKTDRFNSAYQYF